MRRPLVLSMIGLVIGFALAAAGLLAYRAATRTTARLAKPGAGELDVLQAVVSNPAESVVVRGFVMTGPYGLRICRGEKGSPPQCVGPWLDLENVNESSFALRSASYRGRRISWMAEPVGLLGRVAGSHMSVQQVVQ